MYLKSNDLSECSGCGACMYECHFNAISMININGFLYPSINRELCKKCGKCENVCNRIHDDSDFYSPQGVFYGWNTNPIVRKRSTSGGAFPAILKCISDMYQNVKFYGATFDDSNSVIHKGVDSYQLSECFFRSKYVQSKITDCFGNIQKDLNEGKYVVFSGTPCQTNAIRHAINNDKLLLIDLVCHGVSNPQVFSLYLKELEQKYQSKVISYSFRNKVEKKGEKSQRYVFILFENGKQLETRKDIFYLSYFERLFYRESCYKCGFAQCRRGSDITLGDYWGIEKLNPELSDERFDGISLVLANTTKGLDIVKSLNKYMILEQGDYSCAFKGQLSESTKKLYAYNDVEMYDDINISKEILKRVPIQNKLRYFAPTIYSKVGLLWRLIKRTQNN